MTIGQLLLLIVIAILAYFFLKVGSVILIIVIVFIVLWFIFSNLFSPSTATGNVPTTYNAPTGTMNQQLPIFPAEGFSAENYPNEMNGYDANDNYFNINGNQTSLYDYIEEQCGQ